MAKFEFNFDALLNYRSRLEELARKDYLEAKAKLDEVLNSINMMYLSIDQSKARIGQVEMSPNVNLSEISSIHEFIMGQLKKIETARYKSRELMAIAEEKHEIMVEAAKNKKVLEKLKEKRREEFRQEQKKIETKRLDDLVTMRYRGGLTK